MPAPQKYTITVATYNLDFGYTLYGANQGLNEPHEEYVVPNRPLARVTNGILEFPEITFYDTGGCEIFFDGQNPDNFQFSYPPASTSAYVKHTDAGDDENTFDFISIEHSGGTTLLDMRDVSDGGDLSYSSSLVGQANGSYVDLWFPSSVKVDELWTTGDVGQQYEVQLITPSGYNRGNIITNLKNPGGGVLFEEAAYTTTQTAVVTQSADQKGGGGGSRGGKGKGGGGGPPADVIIDLPPQAGLFDLTCHIEGYDFGSDTWYTILSGANITGGNTKQRLTVGSFAADVVNASANDVLPYMWRCRVEHGDATSVTYSVEYKL